MKLWLLKPKQGLPDDMDCWNWPYDKVFGFVIRAETEGGARQCAQQHACDESMAADKNGSDTVPWIDDRYTHCVELTQEGDPGVILIDFSAG